MIDVINTGACCWSSSLDHRYVLRRHVNMLGSGTCCFIGLNPSTADDQRDDPTIRRCRGFAKRLGFQYLVMLNIFAFRSTDPVAMKQAADPVGPLNDHYIDQESRQASVVIAAWGHHGKFRGRDQEVMKLIQQDVWCFGTTKDGSPRHPLYLNQNAELQRYTGT